MHDDHEISNRLLNTSLFSSPPSIRTSSSSNPQNKEQEEEDRKPVVPLNRPTALDERQVTIILLLAQVCAIYDPTPKTFVLNVARFHELGLIDSVGFLSDLGLMHSTIESPRTTATTDLKPKGVGPYDFSSHEMLMISRYQREFFELRGIGRGTFGQVVMATNQFDQTVYAVKKIRFQNKGFGNPWIQKIVREVQCLAKCDHVNVNRYYSAWLEPTWLLQSAQTATTTTMEEEEDNVESHRFSEINVQAPRHRHLLQEIHHLVEIEQGESISMDHTEQQYDDSTFDNLSSSIRFESLDAHQLATSTSSSSSKKPVTYQLTLYIQMALCQQRTLRDWIDERNQNILRDATLTLDQERNLIFFRQLCSGLAHVHAQGIIHRGTFTLKGFIYLCVKVTCNYSTRLEALECLSQSRRSDAQDWRFWTVQVIEKHSDRTIVSNHHNHSSRIHGPGIGAASTKEYKPKHARRNHRHWYRGVC